MHPRALGGPVLGLPGDLPHPQPRQPGQHPIHRRAGAAGPRQRGLRHRARVHQQQRVPGLLRGAPGRGRPAGGRGHRPLPAAGFALHHRGGAGQQLRRQRGLRLRPAPAPDARRDPEGERHGRTELHHRPDHQPGAGPPGPRPRFRGRPVLLGGGPGQRARHARGGHPGARSRDDPGHLPPDRGAALPLPGGERQQRRQSQPGRDHRLGAARGRPGAAGAGALGAPDPGHRLLRRRLGPVGGARHQAGSERLSRHQLPDRGGNHDRHLSPGGPGPRLQRRPRAHRRAAAEPDPAHLPVRDAQRVPRRRRGPRRHLAGSRHHPQPLRAAGHGLGPDLSPAARPRGAERPRRLRPRESPVAPRAGSRGLECGERPLHRLPAPRAVRRPEQALARRRSPTRSTARRSTCC